MQAEQTLILYLTTPTDDRRNMAQFFIRHTNFSSHFHEDVCFLICRLVFDTDEIILIRFIHWQTYGPLNFTSASFSSLIHRKEIGPYSTSPTKITSVMDVSEISLLSSKVRTSTSTRLPWVTDLLGIWGIDSGPAGSWHISLESQEFLGT